MTASKTLFLWPCSKVMLVITCHSQRVLHPYGSMATVWEDTQNPPNYSSHYTPISSILRAFNDNPLKVCSVRRIWSVRHRRNGDSWSMGFLLNARDKVGGSVDGQSGFSFKKKTGKLMGFGWVCYGLICCFEGWSMIEDVFLKDDLWFDMFFEGSWDIAGMLVAIY